MTHESHDVIGQVSSQVRCHKAREACEGNTGIILVGTTQILGGNKWKKISVCVTLCSERRGKIANISNLSDLVCSQHDDISALMKAL